MLDDGAIDSEFVLLRAGVRVDFFDKGGEYAVLQPQSVHWKWTICKGSAL